MNLEIIIPSGEPVRLPSAVTEEYGLQKIDSGLLPAGENRVLTASVDKDRTVWLLPWNPQDTGT